MNNNKLDKSEVMQHLKKYNDSEIFYQQYALLQNDKEALNHFIQQYDQTTLRQKRIYIKEILQKSYKEFEDESAMWDNQDDIYIEKYCRFMPRISAIHDYFEIVYVVESNIDIDIGEKSITLKSGDVCFISPGILHSPHIMEKTIALQMIVRKSTFRQEFFRCLTGNSVISDFFLNALYLQNEGSVLLFHMSSDEEIKNIFFQMYLENHNRYVRYQNILNNLFEILLCHLLRCDSSNIEIKQTCQKADSRITQILQYIENNCKRITIADLSKEFHLSGPYLSKYITNKTGKAFSHILQEIRLEKARNMLCSSNLRVEDIADSVGYRNVEHFIRLFKHKYCKTPNQFRKSK
ncbi:AraC family transcriptional regulator [Lacrimispora sp.]|uniref:AraC family transcriptional regulator n=1 Tax=Lacrimispora sp. TaxID=2719234 RepID=UPI002FDA6CAA